MCIMKARCVYPDVIKQRRALPHEVSLIRFAVHRFPNRVIAAAAVGGKRGAIDPTDQSMKTT